MDRNVIIFRIRRYIFIGFLILLSSIVFIDNIIVRIEWFAWIYVLCVLYADTILKSFGMNEP